MQLYGQDRMQFRTWISGTTCRRHWGTSSMNWTVTSLSSWTTLLKAHTRKEPREFITSCIAYLKKIYPHSLINNLLPSTTHLETPRQKLLHSRIRYWNILNPFINKWTFKKKSTGFWPIRLQGNLKFLKKLKKKLCMKIWERLISWSSTWTLPIKSARNSNRLNNASIFFTA